MKQHNNTTLKKIAQLALLGGICNAAPVQADVTLVYQTASADGAKTQHSFAIAGRFVRVDMDAEPERYWVIDTGLLTMADVDKATQRYTFRKLPRPELPATTAAKQKTSAKSQGEQGADQAASSVPMLAPEPVLVPTRKKQNVAGIICRMVNEVVNDQPVARHCMAGTGPLGITSREMVTLSRLFTTARRLELGWAGVATADERIASVDSRLGEGQATQTLLSVSHDWIPDERMQVSKKYKRVESLQDKPSREQTAAAQAEPEAAQPAPDVEQPAAVQPTPDVEQPAAAQHATEAEQPAAMAE